MPHHTPLIATIVAGLVGAFVLGALAQRLRLSPLVGYLLAGVLVGPFTPGYVADQGVANELAEIGVVLLMFGVGLHFSLKDLLAVRRVAIPGAIGQMSIATVLGIGLAHLMGWTLAAGLVFGLALSVASTVVLLRALQERRLLRTPEGRVAVGWLIVEDLAMVLALVLLPALAEAMTAGSGDPLRAWIAPLGVTLLKVGGFIAFMLIVGRRLIPWALHYIAHTGSRELFRLGVFAIALGVAFGSAALFGVSLALGAFFAGMVLAESELSQRAAEETLPLRDAFAVLFFVSVGMLFNPAVILSQPWPLAGVLAIVIIGKAIAALAIARLFGRSSGGGVVIAASLAQIGEFSFILAGLGVGLGLLPDEGRDLILAGAIVSIMLNPLVFALLSPRRSKPADVTAAPDTDLASTSLSGHAVIVGGGRLGSAVAERLRVAKEPFLVVELDAATASALGARDFEVVTGPAGEDRVLAAAGVARARRLFIAIPDGFEAGQVAEKAHRLNPGLEVTAAARTDAEVAHLAAHGADRVVAGDHQIAAEMLQPEAPEPPDAPRAGSPSKTFGESVFVSPARSKALLDDVERALLGELMRREIWPGEAFSAEPLVVAAAAHGYDEPTVRRALASLISKGLVRDLGDRRITFSKAGFLSALQPV